MTLSARTRPRRFFPKRHKRMETSVDEKSLRAALRVPWPLSHTRRTALLANHPLGSAEITHPFHPRRGQRFVVLKVRRVSGVETLSLRHVELGSFAVPREWTDWAPLDAQAAPTGGQSLLIDAFGLSTLTELVTLLTRNGGLDR